MPGGPLGPASWWAAASKVEVGQTTYPANRGKIGKEGIEGSEAQSQIGGQGRRHGTGKGPGSLDRAKAYNTVLYITTSRIPREGCT